MSSVGPRRLAVFDLDGTLTDTCELDDECYVAALAGVFDLPADRAAYAWERFENVSDTGVVGELLRKEGKDFSEGALRAFEEAFVDRIGMALRRDPERCRPVPGGVELVDRLARDPDWVTALATGGFRASALAKLAHAGFDPPEILRTGNDSPVRARIVEAAVRGAEEAFSTSFESVVLLGDAVWDVATAVELGLPCIGVGRGARAAALAAAGAAAVLPDFVDYERAMATLNRAADLRARDLVG